MNTIAYKFFEDSRSVFYSLIILLVIFFSLTAYVQSYPVTSIDLEFSKAIQEFENNAIISLMKFVSWFGGTFKVVSLSFGAASIFYILKLKKEALFVASTIGVSVINGGIKMLIERPRPAESFVNILYEANNHSFPSGHTSFYIVFFGFLIYLMLRLSTFDNIIRKMIIILSLFLITTIPFSRVYLGVHWLTDVIGGFLLGLIVLITIISLYTRLKNYNEQWSNDQRTIKSRD
ncbi:phosphatase PAP2 family protein [Gramella jeungdoensis]|uniref:Phosphatase PAP2 family protein n=1 Tax=Gramella jeungdoensis TaxID=708091 RepID=A0ABT0Z548_9FLAO|nr:phosphatase PAP2 family protein [Gramella jeungdoensis]MCM8570841.1 phosphatase PAP2 family protein [Gramella jeungdoensis]